MIATSEHPIARVLSELAAKRGFTSLEELAEAVNAAPENAGREDFTAEELADDPRPGFGKHVDAVLHLSTAERMYLAGAWLETIERS